MGKEILMFGDIEIEKNEFYGNKIPILLKDVDIEKVLVSKIQRNSRFMIYLSKPTR